MRTSVIGVLRRDSPLARQGGPFSWGIKEMGSGAWESKVGKITEQNWLKGLQIVQFECPRHPIPSASLWLGEFHFLIFLGNKGNGLWGMKVKSWKIFRTKLAQLAANGPVWMPQALKTPCLIQFGVVRIPFSNYWPPGVIRIGLPVWRWKSWKMIGRKRT